MPRLEQVMDSLPLDQCAGEDRAKNRRPLARSEAFHIHAARQVIELVLRETLHTKGVRRALGENHEQIGQLVFLDEALAIEQQITLPAALGRRSWRPRGLAAIAMPGGDFD